MVKRPLTLAAYSLGLCARVAPPHCDRARDFVAALAIIGPSRTHYCLLPSNVLLSAQEAKHRLREIVEGFFFRRLRTEDGKRIGRLLVKSPPGLRNTRQAIERAIR